MRPTLFCCMVCVLFLSWPYWPSKSFQKIALNQEHQRRAQLYKKTCTSCRLFVVAWATWAAKMLSSLYMKCMIYQVWFQESDIDTDISLTQKSELFSICQIVASRHGRHCRIDFQMASMASAPAYWKARAYCGVARLMTTKKCTESCCLVSLTYKSTVQVFCLLKRHNNAMMAGSACHRWMTGMKKSFWRSHSHVFQRLHGKVVKAIFSYSTYLCIPLKYQCKSA